MNRIAKISFINYLLMANLFYIFALQPSVKVSEKTGIKIHAACSCGCSESTVSCCCNSTPSEVEFQSCSAQQNIFITIQSTFFTLIEKKMLLVHAPPITPNPEFINKKYISQEIFDEIDHPPQAPLF